MSGAEFLSLDNTDILNYIYLLRAYPVHCRMFSSIPSLHLLEARNTHTRKHAHTHLHCDNQHRSPL